jgi:hypothetical protein
LRRCYVSMRACVLQGGGISMTVMSSFIIGYMMVSSDDVATTADTGHALLLSPRRLSILTRGVPVCGVRSAGHSHEQLQDGAVLAEHRCLVLLLEMVAGHVPVDCGGCDLLAVTQPSRGSSSPLLGEVHSASPMVMTVSGVPRLWLWLPREEDWLGRWWPVARCSRRPTSTRTGGRGRGCTPAEKSPAACPCQAAV